MSRIATVERSLLADLKPEIRDSSEHLNTEGAKVSINLELQAVYEPRKSNLSPCRHSLERWLFILVLLFPMQVMAQTTDEVAEATEEPQSLIRIGDGVSLQFSGAVETIHISDSDFEGEQTDSTEFTFSLGAEVFAGDFFSAVAAVELAADGTDTALLVDELYFSVGNDELSPFSFSAGYLTSPFFNSESLHNESHLTVSAFEAKGNVVQITYGVDGFSATGFAVQGRSDWVLKQIKGTAPDVQNQDWGFGANVAYAFAVGNTEIETSVGVTDTIFASEALIFSVPDRQGGLGAAAGLRAVTGPIAISARYISTLETINFYDEDEDITTPSKPAAFAAEISTVQEFVGFDGFAAMGYSRTWGLEGLVPEEQVLVTAGVQIESLKLQVEFGHSWDHFDSDAGTRPTGSFFSAGATFEW